MNTGIYTITNKINNKVYIGFSKNITYRLRQHKSKLKSNKHANIYLQDSVNKYGINNFIFETLEECDYQDCPSLEHYWCNLLNSHNKKFGYNLGNTSNTFSNKNSDNWYFGRKHSKEIREKIKQNIPSRKGISYKDFYENSELEKQKRREGVKKSWERLTEEEKLKRINKIRISNTGKRKGSKNSFAKPVVINEIAFGSLIEARNYFQVSDYILKTKYNIKYE